MATSYWEYLLLLYIILNYYITLNYFFVFCFGLLSELHVTRNLVARDRDQLESLGSFGHSAHFTFDDLCINWKAIICWKVKPYYYLLLHL